MSGRIILDPPSEIISSNSVTELQNGENSSFHLERGLYTILRVRDHLHDLLIRVIFKTIGYDGPYQSPIPPLMQWDSVDWVTPTTAPGLLGFA